MAQTFFYRYVGAIEAADIVTSRMITSKSGVTWFTPDRYDNPQEAQQKLALQYVPTHRIGPIPVDELPDFDARPLRPVAFKYGQPGGGVEGATTKETYLSGIFEFATTFYIS